MPCFRLGKVTSRDGAFCAAKPECEEPGPPELPEHERPSPTVTMISVRQTRGRDDGRIVVSAHRAQDGDGPRRMGPAALARAMGPVAFAGGKCRGSVGSRVGLPLATYQDPQLQATMTTTTRKLSRLPVVHTKRAALATSWQWRAFKGLT